MTGDRGRKVSPPTGGRGGQASSVELWRGRFNASAKESTWCERGRRKPEGRGEANPAGAPKRMVVVGAMCEDAVMEVVCGKNWWSSSGAWEAEGRRAQRDKAFGS